MGHTTKQLLIFQLDCLFKQPQWATPTSMVKRDSLVEQINNYNMHHIVHDVLPVNVCFHLFMHTGVVPFAWGSFVLTRRSALSVAFTKKCPQVPLDAPSQ